VTLDEALFILAKLHTRDASVTGFAVNAHVTLAYSRWTEALYIEAWKTVRAHLHLQTEPPK
jgi:hypothetical protein